MGRIGIAWRLGGVLALVALIGIASVDCATAAGQTFQLTGAEQTYTVPFGVASVEVVAVGGHGGSAAGIAGGAPARASADLPVTPGQVLYVEVAGNGQSAINGGDGGFNFGGAAGAQDAAGGGGESDVRTMPRTSGLSPDSRLLVAAGGGGAAEGVGGNAGSEGAIGNAPGEGGGAGTATAGGVGGNASCGAGENGHLGSGGKGGTSTIRPNSGAGGGGGGLYGGGGGGAGCMSGGGGGGGGSSFVSATASNASVSVDQTETPFVEITPVGPVTATNHFRFGKLKLNKKKGTATLGVRLPGSGTVTLSGKRVVPALVKFGGAETASSLRAPHRVVTLRIKARAKWRRRLEQTGRLMVKVVVTFTPTGGTPYTKSRQIGLKKSL